MKSPLLNLRWWTLSFEDNKHWFNSWSTLVSAFPVLTIKLMLFLQQSSLRRYKCIKRPVVSVGGGMFENLALTEFKRMSGNTYITLAPHCVAFLTAPMIVKSGFEWLMRPPLPPKDINSSPSGRLIWDWLAHCSDLQLQDWRGCISREDDLYVDNTSLRLDGTCDSTLKIFWLPSEFLTMFRTLS